MNRMHMGRYGMDEWGISGKGGGCGSEGEWIWLRCRERSGAWGVFRVGV